MGRKCPKGMTTSQWVSGAPCLSISGGYYLIHHKGCTRPLHRFLWALSQSDPKGAVIHHRNCNSLDNQIENLQRFETLSDHAQEHKRLRAKNRELQRRVRIRKEGNK